VRVWGYEGLSSRGGGVTNSADKLSPEKKAAAIARLSELKGTPPEKKQEVSELPRWVKTALVLREVDGLTYREAAARFNKAPSTLSDYARSPAAKTWI